MREELKTEFFALLCSGLTDEELPAGCRAETDAALPCAALFRRVPHGADRA